MCVRTVKFGAKQLAEGEITGDGRNAVVPMDVGRVMKCAAVVRGVSSYYVCNYGYETFGGGDYPIAENEDEGCYDGGGGVGGS